MSVEKRGYIYNNSRRREEEEQTTATLLAHHKLVLPNVLFRLWKTFVIFKMPLFFFDLTHFRDLGRIQNIF